jgi:2-methylcitrate dehydratase PrpD
MVRTNPQLPQETDVPEGSEGHGRPIAEIIADFAVRTRYEDLPSAVVERAKLLILDAIGIAFASTTFDFAYDALAALQTFGPGDQPVIGLPARLNLRDAVLMNGLLIHGLDFDDTHLSGIVHASASAVPTALGVAAARHLPGRDLLLGYVLAVEVAARVGVAAKGGFHRAGFHPTGVAGAFGCAVAAGRLGRLTTAELAVAQGVALSLASGTLEFTQEGAWTKRIHPGWAAGAGITAAAFAHHGFLGPELPYEGRDGLYRTHLQKPDIADLASLTKGLGEEWQLDEVAVKLFPSCHFTHACIDAALTLADNERLSVDDIAGITCLVHRDVMPVICEPRDRKIAPSSDYEAKFSLPFVVAAALVHGRFTLNELRPSALGDARTLDLASRITHEHDPDSGYPRFYSGEVILRTTDGRELRHREQITRGAPERPVTPDDVIAKFRGNLELAGVDTDGTQGIIDAVLALDEYGDAATFSERVARPHCDRASDPALAGLSL